MGIAAFGATACAETITYTETAMATGTLGGQSFTNALVTLTATGDTSDVDMVGAPVSASIFLPVELNIAGIGSAEFTDTTSVVSNIGGGGVVGFSDNTPPPNNPLGFSILSDVSSTFKNFYDLQSAIGPVDGFAVVNSGVAISTDAGTLVFTSAEDATFQAVLTPAATPEPSSLMLLGTGVLGLVSMRHRLRV
jgi:hypothetical protein